MTHHSSKLHNPPTAMPQTAWLTAKEGASLGPFRHPTRQWWQGVEADAPGVVPRAAYPKLQRVPRFSAPQDLLWGRHWGCVWGGTGAVRGQDKRSRATPPEPSAAAPPEMGAAAGKNPRRDRSPVRNLRAAPPRRAPPAAPPRRPNRHPRLKGCQERGSGGEGGRGVTSSWSPHAPLMAATRRCALALWAAAPDWLCNGLRGGCSPRPQRCGG